jgi:hypothetical protein
MEIARLSKTDMYTETENEYSKQVLILNKIYIVSVVSIYK